MGPPPVAVPWVGRQWSYHQPWPRATCDGGGHHVQLCHSYRPRRSRPQHQGLRPKSHERRVRARVVRLRPGSDRRVGTQLRGAQGGLRVWGYRLPPVPDAARARAGLRRRRCLKDAAACRGPRQEDRPTRRRVPGPPARHS